MKRLRVAVAGTGFGGRVIVPALAAVAEADIVAVTGGADRAKTEALAKSCGAPVWDKTFREVCRDEEFDLAFIASPHEHHADMARAALEAGVNIVCEKPLALSDADVLSLASAAAGSDKLCLVDHQLRFLPAIREARELIRSGRLGRVYHVSASYSTDRYVDPAVAKRRWWFDAGRGGGMLYAVGTHMVDLVRFCLGLEPTLARGCAADPVLSKVMGQGGEEIAALAESMFAGLVDFESDVRAVFQATAVSYKDKSSLSVVFHGERGELWYESPDRLVLADGEGGRRELDFPPAGGANAFVTAFGAFAGALAKALLSGDRGVIADACDFSDYAKTHRVVSAMRRSAETGTPAGVKR